MLTATSLEQLASLLCDQADSASYPQWDRKLLIAYLAWLPLVVKLAVL